MDQRRRSPGTTASSSTNRMMSSHQYRDSFRGGGTRKYSFSDDFEDDQDSSDLLFSEKNQQQQGSKFGRNTFGRYFKRESLMPAAPSPDELCFNCSARTFRSPYVAFSLFILVFLLCSGVIYHFITAHDGGGHSLPRSPFVLERSPSKNEFGEPESHQFPPQKGDQDDREGDIQFREEQDGDVFDLDVNDRENSEGSAGLKAAKLTRNVGDLQRMKKSMLAELVQLEEKRNGIRTSIKQLTERYSQLQNDVGQLERTLSTLENSMEQAKIALNEAKELDTPGIRLPLQLAADDETSLLPKLPSIPKSSLHYCTMETCFDYSDCSLFHGFTVNFNVWPSSASASTQHPPWLSEFLTTATKTSNPITNNSCVNVYFNPNNNSSSKLGGNQLDDNPNSGNTLVISLNQGSASHISSTISKSHTMIASDDFFITKSSSFPFRPRFDVLLPYIVNVDDQKNSLWSVLPLLLPSRRKYLLSFSGQYMSFPENQGQNQGDHIGKIIATIEGLKSASKKTRDQFYFNWQCQAAAEASTKPSTNPNFAEFQLCDSFDTRIKLLLESVFTLIPVLLVQQHKGNTEKSPTITSTLPHSSMVRLAEALRGGSIPILLGGDRNGCQLPFDEVIDWDRVVLRIPSARISELHFILRSLPESDIVEMKRQGRLIYTEYVGTSEAVVHTTLAILRKRIGLPPKETPAEIRGRPAFGPGQWTPSPGQLIEMPLLQDPDEYLGPVEIPFPSPFFTQNFSLQSMYGYSMWNDRFTPFKLYPSIPFRRPLPSEAKFREGTDFGFRPINDGAGGSGKEFSQSLGGNYPREQFTIVMLTYEREAVLVSSLQRLNAMPYLNQIIVVWNSPTPPSVDIIWPKLTAPVTFIHPGVNSLNNRFLPFEQIQTEAVFSIDDDVHLTQAEIIFAFRVWREHRDQIVGFPGRFHAWDRVHNGWLYNSNHSCQLSMVLTGAAFFHKYYAYLYTHEMAPVIRSTVDQLMNCEDLAMNFLVSHVTRKPPIKVTSKWTFRCPGCPETLSADDSHFTERHGCMQLLTNVYGYNPLLYTQYRVDSVLFKTRLPHIHQKCFKFI